MPQPTTDRRHPHDDAPDVLGGAFSDYVLHYCRPKFEWFWEQWAVCHIRCAHGLYAGTAAGLNLTAAFLKAADLVAADHPICGAPVVTTGLTLSGEAVEYTDPCALLAKHDGPCAEL